MNLPVKAALVMAMVSALGFPALAETQTKTLVTGTKSYQKKTIEVEQPEEVEIRVQPMKDSDVAKIEPAAGETTPAMDDKTTTRSLKDDMRLPRKN